jgi:protein SCO1/2
MNHLLTSLLLLTCATLAPAQEGMSPARLEGRDEAASQQDRVGQSIDPSLTFTDERGYPFALKQWFPGETPVVLLLGYYHCPAMCGTVLQAAFRALSDVPFEPGRDYRILNVSIDPRETAETAKSRKDNFLPKLAKTGVDEAWRVLTGSEENIRKLTEAVGFRYYWSEATKQFAHPPSLIFLTKTGRISRIVVSSYFEPDDVRLALVEASEGRLGSFLDQVYLNCLTFDSRSNTYSLTAMTIMRVGGVITVVALAGMIWFMLRRERQTAAAAIA